MKKPNNIENELNKIRVDFYETTKNMSSSDKIAYMKAQVAPLHEKYGIHPVNRAMLDAQPRA